MLILTSEVQVGDYFLLEGGTVIVIKELLSVDYYLCSDNEIHSIDELMPLGSVFVDWSAHPDYIGEAFFFSSGCEENGETLPFVKPAHIVQNYMREKYSVEYPLEDDNIIGEGYSVI